MSAVGSYGAEAVTFATADLDASAWIELPVAMNECPVVARETVGEFLEAYATQADLKGVGVTAAADYAGGAAVVAG